MKQIVTLLMIFIASVASVASAQVKEINSLADIHDNGRPFIVKAYADWCGPCRYYTPVFDEAAKMYDGRVDFYMIDIDNNASRDFVRKFHITSIPQTILFLGKNKKESYTISGAQSLDGLLQFIQENTGRKPQK